MDERAAAVGSGLTAAVLSSGSRQILGSAVSDISNADSGTEAAVALSLRAARGVEALLAVLTVDPCLLLDKANEMSGEGDATAIMSLQQAETRVECSVVWLMPLIASLMVAIRPPRNPRSLFAEGARMRLEPLETGRTEATARHPCS